MEMQFLKWPNETKISYRWRERAFLTSTMGLINSSGSSRRSAYRTEWPWRPSGWLDCLVRRLLRSVVFSAHNLVLNTLQILEVESIVARGSIFWILSWWTHYLGPNSIQFAMQSVDFGARFRFKCKMM